jgi:hypothetical protein
MSFEIRFRFGKDAPANILLAIPRDATVSKVIELVSAHVHSPVTDLNLAGLVLPKGDQFADHFEAEAVYDLNLSSAKVIPIDSLLSEIAPAICELDPKLDVSNANLLYEAKGSFSTSSFWAAVGECAPTLLRFRFVDHAGQCGAFALSVAVPWSTSGSPQGFPGMAAYSSPRTALTRGM